MITMTADSSKLLIYFDDEEHIVRRLGSAVISCWHALPEAVQNTLLDRASSVLDDDSTEPFDREMRRFLLDHTAHRS